MHNMCGVGDQCPTKNEANGNRVEMFTAGMKKVRAPPPPYQIEILIHNSIFQPPNSNHPTPQSLDTDSSPSAFLDFDEFTIITDRFLFVPAVSAPHPRHSPDISSSR